MSAILDTLLVSFLQGLILFSQTFPHKLLYNTDISVNLVPAKPEFV